MAVIYALTEPATGEVRYVGYATDPVKRLSAHLRQAAGQKGRQHKAAWIDSLKARGLRPGLQGLTPAAVSEIRRRAADGETQAALARAFSISPPTVSNIVRRKTWRHLAEGAGQCL